MLGSAVEDEVDLPPPWGAISFEPAVGLENKLVLLVKDGRHAQNERSLLQARLLGIYDQVDTTFIEKDLIGLAIEWNKLQSTTEVEKGRLQKEAVYTVGKKDYAGDSGLIMNSGVADFQTRLQELYRLTEKPDKEQNFMILAKAWNASSSANEGIEQRLQNNEVYMVERSASLVDDGVSSRTEAPNVHARLKNLYEHAEQSEMERAYIRLAKE